MTRRRWIADTATETTASLLGAQAAHLARVLRAQPGARMEVVANGRVFHAVIAGATVDEVRFTLLEELSAGAALPITLVLAIYKFDRMEWAIEKATELGVQRIAPVIARRTEKHLGLAAEKRVERWRRLAHEAAQQSRRADLPAIEGPVPLVQRIQQLGGATRLLLSERETVATLSQALDEALAKDTIESPAFEIAIGPEGGWTVEEAALFEANHWRSVSLGPRILRAETAAIAALAVLAAAIEA